MIYKSVEFNEGGHSDPLEVRGWGWRFGERDKQPWIKEGEGGVILTNGKE